MPKPIILTDVDGVLADVHPPLLAYINRHGYNIQYEDWTTYWAKEAFGQEVDDLVSEFFNQPELYDTDQVPPIFPVPGALEGLGYLRSFAKVIAVSSIYPGHATSKMNWLINVAGFNRHDIFFATHKHLIQGDVLIEDSEKQLKKWAPRAAIVIDCPWNRAYQADNLWRARDWVDVVWHVRRIIRGVE